MADRDAPASSKTIIVEKSTSNSTLPQPKKYLQGSSKSSQIRSFFLVFVPYCYFLARYALQAHCKLEKDGDRRAFGL
jgi:hypothetical protein